MSILDKVKIGNSVKVNLKLSKDRLTKETIDAINISSLGKISDFRITDGKGIGVVLELENSLEILEILLYGEFKINPHYKTHNDEEYSYIRI